MSWGAAQGSASPSLAEKFCQPSAPCIHACATPEGSVSGDSKSFECRALSACGEKRGSAGSGARAGTPPELAAGPWLLSHGCVALLCALEKEEERRKYSWHTWAGSGHVPAGSLQHSYTCARKHPESNCESNMKYQTFNQTVPHLFPLPVFSGFVCLP